MEISSAFEDDVLVLGISGDFDTTETENYAAEIAAAIDADVVKVLVDLAGMDFINSTALGALLLSHKRLSQYGGGIAAFGASLGVEKTFKLLELHRKIPLLSSLEEGIEHFAKMSPEGVSATGEEVEFFRPDAEDTFGPRPRRGRMEEINDAGLTFSFENLDQLDPVETFPEGAPVELRFLLPLYHPTHIFKVESKVSDFEAVGRGNLQVTVEFTNITGAEKAAVAQYVKDLRFLKGEE